MPVDVVFITHNELGMACLEELHELGANIEHVFSRPPGDDIADQVRFESFSETADCSLDYVETVDSPAAIDAMESAEPDLLFVVGWSKLVPRSVIDVPSLAALGMHPAPLPRGRGRAPIAWTLIKGLESTKLSLFHLVEEADAGDLVGQETIDVDVTDDAQGLYNKVVEAGRGLIRDNYPAFEQSHVPRNEQNDEAATWWPKREPHHGLIDWTRSPMAVYNWIRGLTRPYPGAFSYLDGTKVFVWSAEVPDSDAEFVEPGEIVYRDGSALGVGTWEGIIEITEVQIDGDEAIPAGALVDRYEVGLGDAFENARDLLF